MKGESDLILIPNADRPAADGRKDVHAGGRLRYERSPNKDEREIRDIADRRTRLKAAELPPVGVAPDRNRKRPQMDGVVPIQFPRQKDQPGARRQNGQAV